MGRLRQTGIGALLLPILIGVSVSWLSPATVQAADCKALTKGATQSVSSAKGLRDHLIRTVAAEQAKLSKLFPRDTADIETVRARIRTAGVTTRNALQSAQNAFQRAAEAGCLSESQYQYFDSYLSQVTREWNKSLNNTISTRVVLDANARNGTRRVSIKLSELIQPFTYTKPRFVRGGAPTKIITVEKTGDTSYSCTYTAQGSTIPLTYTFTVDKQKGTQWVSDRTYPVTALPSSISQTKRAQIVECAQRIGATAGVSGTKSTTPTVTVRKTSTNAYSCTYTAAGATTPLSSTYVVDEKKRVYWASDKQYEVGSLPANISDSQRAAIQACASKVRAQLAGAPPDPEDPTPTTPPDSDTPSTPSESGTEQQAAPASVELPAGKDIGNLNQLKPVITGDDNPLTGKFKAASLVDFFTKSIPSALMFFLGIVVMVVFLLSALRYLLSAGGDDKKGAIQGMTYAALGAFVVVLGYAIISLIQRFVL
ncbi:MAG: hypothetical protein ACOYBJ_02810 [Patescibacteria group bacterium]|jgi:hypothetical protein